MINTTINLLRKWQDWLDQAWFTVFVIVDCWIAWFVTAGLGREIRYELVG